MDMLTEKKVNIHISDSALEHFNGLIEKEAVEGMGLRVFLDVPGSPMAEVGITFCVPGENKSDDIQIEYSHFILFIDKASSAFLEDAEVDYKSDNLGGQLAITAPNIRGAEPGKDASLHEKVTYLLNSEVNPNLASHGGMVSLIEITNNNEVVLQFGGGCHGCGMVDVTLKEGIEKTLKNQLPEITAVVDVTDHTQGENPYY